MGQLTLLITGAGGFLGRHAVAEARQRGHIVRALVRRADSILSEWQGDPGIQPIICDLGQDPTGLAKACQGVQSVIHAAARIAGADADHAIDTRGATAAILNAMDPDSHFVLISSMSVYDLMPVQSGAMVDEATPTEQDGLARDAYCRAKLAQEALVASAAQEHGFPLTILRPGALFGPDHLWNGHLGIAIGPVLLRIGSRGQIPLCYVEHAAKAAVSAAEHPAGLGVINVVDGDLPDRAQYAQALKQTGWPRAILPVPLALFNTLAGLVGNLPGVPGLLRMPVLAARMKPVSYSNKTLMDRLGDTCPHTFSTAMARAIAGAS